MSKDETPKDDTPKEETSKEDTSKEETPKKEENYPLAGFFPASDFSVIKKIFLFC